MRVHDLSSCWDQEGYERALLNRFSLSALRQKARFFCDPSAVAHSSPPEEMTLQAVSAGIDSIEAHAVQSVRHLETEIWATWSRSESDPQPP